METHQSLEEAVRRAREYCAGMREKKTEGQRRNLDRFRVGTLRGEIWIYRTHRRRSHLLIRCADLDEARHIVEDEQPRVAARWKKYMEVPAERRAVNQARRPEGHETTANPQDFLRRVPLRGVQFGLWVDSDRRHADLATTSQAFADLARSHSDDTASAVDGGDLGWRSPGELDPAFEEQLDRLAPGEVGEPFRTRFGWHLAQVEARREVDETAQTLRQRAINHLARGRANEAIELWLRRLRENAYIRILLHGADA